jgi:outer membrane biosynthesis protein TonB
LQLNKRDVDGALDKDVMIEKLKRGDWAIVEACAFKGEGVFPTLKKLAGMVIAKLNDQDGYSKSAAAPSAPSTVIPPVATPIAPKVEAPKAELPKQEAPKPSAPIVPPKPTPPVSAPQQVVEKVSEPKVEPVPVAATSENVVPKKEESKSDLIAVRLAKMRAEKANDSNAPTAHANEVDHTPRKLPSKGFIGFIKKLFGKG